MKKISSTLAMMALLSAIPQLTANKPYRKETIKPEDVIEDLPNPNVKKINRRVKKGKR